MLLWRTATPNATSCARSCPRQIMSGFRATAWLSSPMSWARRHSRTLGTCSTWRGSFCSSCKEVRSENALYGLCSPVAVDVDAGQHYTSPMDPALLHNSVMAPCDSNVCKGANTERDAVPTRLPRLWVAQVTTIVVCYCKILHYFCTYNTSMHRCVVRFMKVNILSVLTGMYPDTVLLIVTNAKLFNAISRT